MKKFILLFCFQMGLGLLLHAEVSPPDRWERQDHLMIRSISPKEPLPAGQPIELKLTVDATLMSADTASVYLILVDPATKRGRPHMIRDLLRGAQTVELSATVTPELNSARLEVRLIINAKNEQTGKYGVPFVTHRCFIDVEQSPVEDIKADKSKQAEAVHLSPKTDPGNLPAPEQRVITMSELKQQLLSLNGKIVPVQINYARSLTQLTGGGYSVRAGTYNHVGSASTETLFLPADGQSLFDKIQALGVRGGSGETVYVHVRTNPPFIIGGVRYAAEVVGLRYRSDKKMYSW